MAAEAEMHQRLGTTETRYSELDRRLAAIETKMHKAGALAPTLIRGPDAWERIVGSP